MSIITMAQLDRMLGLKRGAANQMRKRQVFDAFSFGGRLWGIEAEDFDKVKAAIEAYRSEPNEVADYLSVIEAAERLNIARSTVYNLISLERLKAHYSPNGRLFVTMKSVEEYRARRLPPGMGIRLGRKRK